MLERLNRRVEEIGTLQSKLLLLIGAPVAGYFLIQDRENRGRGTVTVRVTVMVTGGSLFPIHSLTL